MMRKPIQTLPGSILPYPGYKPSDIAACWIDCADESTHSIDPDGTRWAHCKLGSGNKFGPVTKDSDGRWCVESVEQVWLP